jgi:phosphonoacetate hydrolase
MLTRRTFLASAAALPLRAQAQRRTVVVMLVDGFAPEYLQRSEMPNLRRLAREGFHKIGRGMVPTVTNVNNASVITGSFPEQHGITSNFWRNPANGQLGEMNTADLLLRPTLLERWAQHGRKTAIVSAKAKVLSLCGKGAQISHCAEAPSAESIARIGPKPNMYSAESNDWLMRSAIDVLKRERPDLLYISTTDYMMHTYPPEDERSLAHLHQLDKNLGDVLNAAGPIEFYLTADHGMSAIHEAVDLDRVLARAGIPSETVPIVKDKHKAHHQNLGGSMYVYCRRPEDVPRAAQHLRETPGVDEVLLRQDAVNQFRLYAPRVGDLLVLGKKGVAFGSLESEREPSKVRTHGSRHEAQVPLFIWGRKVTPKDYEFNLDLTRNLAL